jgi:hypothetical protein
VWKTEKHSSFFLFYSFREEEKHPLVRNEEGRMKKEKSTLCVY